MKKERIDRCSIHGVLDGVAYFLHVRDSNPATI